MIWAIKITVDGSTFYWQQPGLTNDLQQAAQFPFRHDRDNEITAVAVGVGAVLPLQLESDRQAAIAAGDPDPGVSTVSVEPVPIHIIGGVVGEGIPAKPAVQIDP